MELKNDFEEFACDRCEEELMKNIEYINAQKQLADAYKNNDIETLYELASEMRFITAATSYKLAIKDIFRLVQS